jgi:hypothetical protein
LILSSTLVVFFDPEFEEATEQYYLKDSDYSGKVKCVYSIPILNLELLNAPKIQLKEYFNNLPKENLERILIKLIVQLNLANKCIEEKVML